MNITVNINHQGLVNLTIIFDNLKVDESMKTYLRHMGFFSKRFKPADSDKKIMYN